MSYPADWPRCPVCGDFALDGKRTCGRVECSRWRDPADPRLAWLPVRCDACGARMPERLMLVAQTKRLADGSIGILNPAAAKVCGYLCLATWASAQLALGPHHDELPR